MRPDTVADQSCVRKGHRGNDANPVLLHKLSGGIRTDGTQPSSIWVDWSSVTGAAYEIQWFSDAMMAQMIGSATVTSTAGLRPPPSGLEIQGLEHGKQYWFRVRAVCANQPGPWSDQATRVANI